MENNNEKIDELYKRLNKRLTLREMVIKLQKEFESLIIEFHKLGWHNVNEELPSPKPTGINKKISGWCHIYIPSFNKKFTYHGFYNTEKKVWITHIKGYHRTKKVTHWMEMILPTIKENKNGKDKTDSSRSK